MRTTVRTLRNAVLLLMLVPVAACAKPGDQTTATGKSATAATGLTLQDFVIRHERKLLAGDVDGDGKLSNAEFIAAAKSGKGDPAKRFDKMDRNGDGMLDKAEIDATFTRRFNRLDVDGDGMVSAGERSAGSAKSGRAGDAAT